MIVINFIFPVHENLPEIKHYIAYFSMHDIVCLTNALSIPKFDKDIEKYVEWHIMGTHFYNQPRFLNQVKGRSYLIHEYASLSTGKNKFIKLFKDILKHNCSHRPDYQLFLNKYIQSKMSVRGIPGELRDMGVCQEFIKNRHHSSNKTVKHYDFVYVGSMAAERKIEHFLDSYIMRQKKILLIGSPSEYLVKRYKKKDNIHFIGRVEQSEIPNLIANVKVCINYIPDVYPYNRQTSTKLIEYLTLGKDVISNKYKWVMDFVNDNNLEYESIDNNFIYIHNAGDYIAQDWHSVIDNLNITRMLKNNESF